MAFHVSTTRRSVSKTNLLALLMFSGCSSADFTNVRHVAAGGAPNAGAGDPADGDAAGVASTAGMPNAAGGRSATGGTTPLPASAGHPSVSSSGAAGVDIARGGSATQAGASGTGGRLTTGASSGMPAGTGGLGGNSGAPPFGGMSSMLSGSGGEAIGGCNHQLLANGEFEAGPGSPWHESSDWPGLEIIVAASEPGLQAEGVTPYGGNYLVWLGGIPDNPYDHYEVTLTQELTIPATAAELTLSGEYLVHSEDGAEGAYDEAHLQLNLGDEVGWLAQSLTNQDMGHDWKSFTARTTDLDNLRGKSVTFIAYSRTDLDGKTSFWLDDLRLVATCGR